MLARAFHWHGLAEHSAGRRFIGGYARARR